MKAKGEENERHNTQLQTRNKLFLPTPTSPLGFQMLFPLPVWSLPT